MPAILNASLIYQLVPEILKSENITKMNKDTLF